MNLDSFSNVLRELIGNEFKSLLKLDLEQPESSKFVVALKKLHVLAVYPFGSRLYGTNTSESDYDYLIVVSNLHRVQRECEFLCKALGIPFGKSTTLVKVHGEMHYNNVQLEFGLADIGVYDELYWQELLNHNVIWILVCSFLPPELVPLYHENKQFNSPICKPKLHLELFPDMQRNLHKARTFFKMNEMMKCKKRLIHILRYTHYTIQLMNHNKIIDISEGNKYWADIENSENFPRNEWTEYQSWFKYYFNKLYKIVGRLADPPSFNIVADPLCTVNFLRNFGVEALERDFYVKVVKSKENLKIFNSMYSNVETIINSECFGGICVKNSQDFRILAHSFTSFEKDSNKAFPINNCDLYEKLDGFLVTMYWENGKWQLLVNPEIVIYMIGQQEQTYKKRGIRELSSSYSGKNRSEDICKMMYDLEIQDEETIFKMFEEIFWNLWYQLGYQLPKQQQYCYMFELLHTFYRVIVPQEKSRIVCTGIRNLATLQEENFHEIANQYNWETVQPLSVLDNVKPQDYLDTLRGITTQLKPWQFEGFVLLDKSTFQRRKFIAPGYVAICDILVAMNKYPKEMEETFMERFLILVLLFEKHGNEICTYFTELQGEFYTLLQRVRDIAKEVNAMYDNLCSTVDSKEHTNAIKMSRYPSLLFLMKKTNVRCEDIIHYQFSTAFSTWKKILFK